MTGVQVLALALGLSMVSQILLILKVYKNQLEAKQVEQLTLKLVSFVSHPSRNRTE